MRLQSAFVRKPDWNVGLHCGYERLLEFGRKHLPDRFYLEGGQRKSLRGIIVREMVSNTLIHREYTSSYQAKFVIERNRMCVENANRAAQEACLTPDNAEPNPKNPIIASFFRAIGYADQLGSGVRNLFKYSRVYSGGDPEFIEGDVSRIIVPLDETLSGGFESAIDGAPPKPPKLPPKPPKPPKLPPKIRKIRPKRVKPKSPINGTF